MSHRVKIITDSASDFSEELAAKYDVSVIPLTVRFDDREFVDRIELTHDDFLRRMSENAVLPSTAAPSPGAFEAAFRQAKEGEYTEAVCITMSSKLSATHQAAVAGAKHSADVIDVEVIDSMQCTIGESILVRHAAERATDGASAKEIAAEVSTLRKRIELIAALDTLENLKKGGRIGKTQAFFGTLLAMKPVIAIQDGEVAALARPRTRAKALNYLIQYVQSQLPVERVVIGHTGAQDIDTFVSELHAAIPDQDVEISSVGPIIATHGGQGLIGVAFVRRSEQIA